MNSEQIRDLHICVPNYRAPNLTQIQRYMKEVENCFFNQKKCVAIHCGGGKGRAGTLIACLIMKFGLQFNPLIETSEMYNNTPQMSAAKVISHLRYVRPGSIETEVQENSITEYGNLLWSMIGEEQQTSESKSVGSKDSITNSQKNTKYRLKDQNGTIKAKKTENESIVSPQQQQQNGNSVRNDRLEEQKEKEIGMGNNIKTYENNDMSSNYNLNENMIDNEDPTGLSLYPELSNQQKNGLTNSKYPQVIILMGIPGSGKSTFCKMLNTINRQQSDYFENPNSNRNKYVYQWVFANQDDLGMCLCDCVCVSFCLVLRFDMSLGIYVCCACLETSK